MGNLTGRKKTHQTQSELKSIKEASQCKMFNTEIRKYLSSKVFSFSFCKFQIMCPFRNFLDLFCDLNGWVVDRFECYTYLDHLYLTIREQLYRWIAHNDLKHYHCQLWSNTGCCGSFIWEEAFEEKYLPNTNNKKNDCFPYWPIGYSCI